MRHISSILVLLLLLPGSFYNALASEKISDTSQFHVVVNIPERTLRLYDTNEINDFVKPILTFRVAVGLRKYPTPIFNGSIISKRPSPTWFVPKVDWAGELAGQIIPFNNTENPFRARNEKGRIEGYFLALGVEGVGLHSTCESNSIGKLASHGCIRMKLKDVRYLYQILPEKTPVSVTYKLFRLEETETGLVIHSFEDVYKKMNELEKMEHLSDVLEENYLELAMLTPDDITLLISGKKVIIENFNIASLNTMKVNYHTSYEPTVTEAATVLARTVSMMRR